MGNDFIKLNFITTIGLPLHSLPRAKRRAHLEEPAQS